MSHPRLTVSVVSHGHGTLLPALIEDLSHCVPGALEVILTHNVPDPSGTSAPVRSAWLTELHNSRPRGFAANHNAAFRHARGDAFCVLNPDVRLPRDPFPTLLDALTLARGGIVAPSVLAPDGSIEDSARAWPTPARLAARLAGYRSPPVRFTDVTDVDWVAGMCMLMTSADYRRLGGFDEGYFLYYEDVDLCARATLAGGRVLLVPTVQIVHDARRASHRNIRHALWHVGSMLRFLGSSTRREMRRRR